MDIVGKTISHYRILERLGGGGMGVVYKAEDSRLERIVALKFLNPGLADDERTRARFLHEAQAASGLQHHNICTIHEIDQTPDGRMFICMDYYPGSTLKALIERGLMPMGQAVEIAAQAAEGLAKAHAAGMVHRDIKPANIAVTGDGAVKILDFGLAKLTDRTRVTRMGTTVGTVSYMSPEQARGEDVGAGADVWSLGVILYEMITGRLPFRATHDAALLYAILNEEYPPVTELREDVPPQLARVVGKALSKDPDERYRDAAAMASDLRAAAREPAVEGRREAASGGAGAGASGSRVKVWLPIALVVAVAAAFLLLKPVLFEDELASAPRPIAVISFENRTGDQSYDYLREVIPNLLITSLEQSKYLSVITWERMHDLLRQAGRGDVTAIDGETGFEVCRMDGIDTIVLGSFAKAGEVFVTDVKVLDVGSKQLLKSASAKGNGVGSILATQVDELGREISRGVGLSERSITAGGGRPIATVTTRSMHAYQYFLNGQESMRKLYWDDARRSLKEAVALDSTFAMAWSLLGWVDNVLGDVKSSKRAYEKALALSARAPEKERLWIEFCYATMIENDDDKAAHLLIELTAKYPREKDPFVRLGSLYKQKRMFDEAKTAYQAALSLDPDYGFALNAMAYLYVAKGEYERAIEYFERYASANPGDANPFDSMGELYFTMGALDESIAMYKKAAAAKPGFGSEQGVAYVLAFREDYAGAIEYARKFVADARSPGREGDGHIEISFYSLFSCRYQLAIESIRRAEQTYDRIDNRWAVAGCRWMEAWARYLLGEYTRSRECLGQSFEIASAVDRERSGFSLVLQVAYGLIDLREGLVDEAERRLDDVEAALPRVAAGDPNSAELAGFLSGLYRAEMCLAEGRIDECIAVCRELPLPRMPSMGKENLLIYNYPIERDVLARAYVAKGARADAIAEYERLTTFDPQGKDRRVIYPLFHYRLARLYEEEGTRDKAAKQYRKFLEICGDADPTVAEIAEARRRLASLAEY
jgi:tetratricopeptide (TPR) repeat protein